MNRKFKRWFPAGFLAASVFSAGIIFGLLVLRQPDGPKQLIEQTVLGEISDRVADQVQTQFERAAIPSVSPTVPPPTPTLPDNAIALVDVPTEVTLPSPATFTWTVNGPSKIIRTTTVYYGTESSPGPLAKTVVPADVRYSDMLKDFMEGNYSTPLVFVGNANFSSSGTYYYRAYALIAGKHYWSDERTITVKPEPRNEIHVINYPSALFNGDTATFTWEVTGPAGTTPYTAIVGGKESKPGGLGEDIGREQTPYGVFISDFTAGNFAVPLRFIGNYKVTEPGVFYFRALVFINGKNIWSDEYSFTVQ